jgi:hypothetical protein
MNGKLITQHCVNSTSKTYHGEQWVRAEVTVHGSPTFAVETIPEGEVPCFQQSRSKGLHYIFSVGVTSGVRAANRGGGWLGRLSRS